MSQYEIEGGYPLVGEIDIQGSKNAALPILAATVLHKGTSCIHHCPRIRDVENMVSLLSYLGCQVEWIDKNELLIDATTIENRELPAKRVKEMRASVLFLGSLLARFGEAEIVYPGGCTIGSRPIDFHLAAFKKMNIEVLGENDYVKCKGYAKGTTIVLPFPSVGATENIILAAVLAKGTTIVYGAAKEPEICCLCEFLRSMGAQIFGDGESILVINGVNEFHDTDFAIYSDRIAAATYACAVMSTGGRVIMHMNHANDLTSVFMVMRQMGADLVEANDYVGIKVARRMQAVPFISTRPYPGFPTDVQSQLLAVLCTAKGTGIIEENVFNARFDVAGQLINMGANICIMDKRAYVIGVSQLIGTDVLASDLRGAAALVVAGLGARGITKVSHIHYLERGYENMAEQIQSLGGNICVK